MTLLADIGLRCGELADLRASGVDLSARSLHVHQAVMFAGGRALYGPPKTLAGIREVSRSTVAVATLNARPGGPDGSYWLYRTRPVRCIGPSRNALPRCGIRASGARAT